MSPVILMEGWKKVERVPSPRTYRMGPEPPLYITRPEGPSEHEPFVIGGAIDIGAYVAEYPQTTVEFHFSKGPGVDATGEPVEHEWHHIQGHISKGGETQQWYVDGEAVTTEHYLQHVAPDPEKTRYYDDLWVVEKGKRKSLKRWLYRLRHPHLLRK
jgi:hypothetical protein